MQRLIQISKILISFILLVGSGMAFGVEVLKPGEKPKPVCVSNLEEFEKVKTKFPSGFQKIPVYYRTVAVFTTRIALGITASKDGRLKLRKVVSPEGGNQKSDNEFYVKKVCYFDNRIVFEAEDGNKIDFKADGETLSYGIALNFHTTDVKNIMDKTLYPSTRAGTTIPYELRNGSK